MSTKATVAAGASATRATAPDPAGLRTAPTVGTPVRASALPPSIPVKRLGPPLQAIRLTARRVIDLPDGPVLGQDGQWLILRGTQAVALLPDDATLQAEYQLQIPGAQTLPPTVCRQLDDLLGVGATQTSDDLLRAVQRLARIEIGGVTLPFTPGQLEELKHRATKRGRTVGQEIEAVVQRIQDELFYGGVGARR